MTAPVLLVFFSRTRVPASGQLADDLTTLATEFDGRFLAGLVDIDAAPGIAQAMQIPSVPLVVVVARRAGRCRCCRTSCRSRSCAPRSPR